MNAREQFERRNATHAWSATQYDSLTCRTCGTEASRESIAANVGLFPFPECTAEGRSTMLPYERARAVEQDELLNAAVAMLADRLESNLAANARRVGGSEKTVAFQVTKVPDYSTRPITGEAVRTAAKKCLICNGSGESAVCVPCPACFGTGG